MHEWRPFRGKSRVSCKGSLGLPTIQRSFVGAIAFAIESSCGF
jgi:hypothetical protein